MDKYEASVIEKRIDANSEFFEKAYKSIDFEKVFGYKIDFEIKEPRSSNDKIDMYRRYFIISYNKDMNRSIFIEAYVYENRIEFFSGENINLDIDYDYEKYLSLVNSLNNSDMDNEYGCYSIYRLNNGMTDKKGRNVPFIGHVSHINLINYTSFIRDNIGALIINSIKSSIKISNRYHIYKKEYLRKEA